MRKLGYFFGFLILLSCGEDDPIVINQGGNQESTVSFTQASAQIDEGNTGIDVIIALDKAATATGTISVLVSEISATYGEDYTTNPAPIGGFIELDIINGQTQSGFRVTPVVDSDSDTELLNFTIAEVSGERLLKGTLLSLDISITDESTIDPQYQACIPVLSENELTVVTWNIEQFPMVDNVTVDLVEEIIENLNADIIAVQEISGSAGRSAFNTLVSRLEGYSGEYFNVDNGLELGYIYKTSEITSFSELSIIYASENSAFPREPVLATATHKNGLEVHLINLHLKCCSDGEDRRLNASVLLKDYIDNNLSNENVIVLGDFNDDIESGSPFSNFINDADNYMFADMDIMLGSTINWSYPSWPSHLDHILITNELVDNLVSVETVKLENCLPSYSSSVSDHRPVIATFSN